MTKREMTMKGLELVAYAGEARSILLECLDDARNKNFKVIDKKMQEAEELLNKAHSAQTDMLFAEAREEYNDVTITMVHGQDHLMTTVLLKELTQNLIELWRKK